MITKYDKICVVCGRPKDHIHHLVYGRGVRDLSDADGLTVPLCYDCHKKVHEFSGAWSKIAGQLAFELDQVSEGKSKEQARGEFKKRYGRSYL